ncbi:pyrroloquinoline quinone-dependent dehydrogenase [Paracidobacterium acidisoli]|uniref:Pyrroloquinoline quinone-dependent dehydrogenase n=1 Tax=Paracidobacterium acidisoli TaxID=2303751 RepID=A0A372IMI4_9BACT|nr:pyrroloquinoline quinone-dependent dehydrogenase [Paracidobacterium acidisoli]
MRRVLPAIAILSGFVLSIASCPAATSETSHEARASRPSTEDWQVYDGNPEQNHYSSLTQINRSNVNKLVVAWKYDTGQRGGLETNPIIVDGVMWARTPNQGVIALNAATGKLIWQFDSGVMARGPVRGVAYWTDGRESRIFAGVRNYLYALDAKTGKAISTFGENGRIDLRKGLGRDYEQQSIALTSPGTIYKDLIIVGGEAPETHPAPPGDIRAFDVRTGALHWTFHTIPHPGEFGYGTWPKDAWKDAGAANNWTGMTVDTKRGIVYVPTGSAVFDFYGGDRIGDDLFADSLVALDAETGKRIWHFQGVHHDLWDRDFPAPPVLLTVMRDGKPVDAIAQTTKSGYVFLLDRTNGRSLFPLQEEHYPSSSVPGEKTSPTQSLPTLPAPYTQQSVTADTLTNRTPEAHAWAEKQFSTFIGGGQFVPPSVDKLTVDMPGFAGGGEWGGPAVDPNTGVLYVNANDTAWLVGLTVPPPPGSPGERIYQNQCAICHGINRAGSPPAIPALRGIEGILTDQEIADTIRQGKGRMPPFNSLGDTEIQSLVRYLTREPQQQQQPRTQKAAAASSSSEPVAAEAGDESAKNDMPYKTIGFRRFLDPDGYPATAPPWGTLSAIDMNTGKYLWKIPFGEYPELAAKGMADTGSDNYGGPVVTASGLLFIGASVFDQKFHVYDAKTGKLLWETELPYSGLATPSTYMVNGKQYIVIAAGGGQSSRKPSGGVYIAFSLP